MTAEQDKETGQSHGRCYTRPWIWLQAWRVPGRDIGTDFSVHIMHCERCFDWYTEYRTRFELFITTRTGDIIYKPLSRFFRSRVRPPVIPPVIVPPLTSGQVNKVGVATHGDASIASGSIVASPPAAPARSVLADGEIPPREISDDKPPSEERSGKLIPAFICLAAVVILSGGAFLWYASTQKAWVTFSMPETFSCGQTLEWTEHLGAWEPVAPDVCEQGDTYEVKGKILNPRRGMTVHGWIHVGEINRSWPAVENAPQTKVGAQVDPIDGDFTLHFCLSKSEDRTFRFNLKNAEGKNVLSPCTVHVREEVIE